ncbi:MAG: leucine-rich repeat protein [Clostridia bacterium]|nr:leucine-rich repeat protein [Clostridia bacterium]
MKINGISYWVKDGKCEMLNLDDGLKILHIPAFMDKVNGEVIGLCGGVEKFIVEDGNPNYYIKDNCLISKDGELIAGAADSVIPTDGSVKRIGNMAFLHKAPMHLVIPDGVKSIGYRAFAENENLHSVYIPESVGEISCAFERCNNLTAVFFGGSREEWESVMKGHKVNPFGAELEVYCKTEKEGESYGIDGRHVCPICGKTMFPGNNSCDICMFCGWEDDVDYERFPDMESCANGYTVAEYRKMYFERVKENPNYNWWAEVNEQGGRK